MQYRLKSGLAALVLAAACMVPAIGQEYTLSPDLAAKVASHPHVRQLTNWGSRPEWSADSRKLLFVSKEYGDVFELDVVTGQTRPLTFHFPHHGFFRAYYLVNGDYLLTGAREHDLSASAYGRFFQTELWLLKGDLSEPPVPLGLHMNEGVAVSRNGMQIIWSQHDGDLPPKVSDETLLSDMSLLMKPNIQMWAGEIAYADGVPEIRNRRLLLDCRAPTGTLAEFNAKAGNRCLYLEPQNLVPPDDHRVTFTMGLVSPDNGFGGAGAYVLDLNTNRISALNKQTGYFEPEGIFPDGEHTLVEHPAGSGEAARSTSRIDLWRLSTDGSGALTRVTSYNNIDPRLKSNQGVVSPDGRWMAFGVSTSDIEAAAPGQGIGLFLMDLKAAGLN